MYGTHFTKPVPSLALRCLFSLPKGRYMKKKNVPIVQKFLYVLYLAYFPMN